MNKRRLLKLADLLEADAKNKKGIKFDFGDWGAITNKDQPMSCGTYACALGLAALSGQFKRDGLDYGLKAGAFSHHIHFKWNGKETSPLMAARRLFDISPKHAEYLFIPHDFNNQGAGAERRVAKRIRNFVAGKVSP